VTLPYTEAFHVELIEPWQLDWQIHASVSMRSALANHRHDVKPSSNTIQEPTSKPPCLDFYQAYSTRSDHDLMTEYLKTHLRTMPSPQVKIAVQSDPFDIAAETDALIGDDTSVGAVASFTGKVRAADGARQLAAMTLEHYPGMTERQMAAIAQQAMARWPLHRITLIHRHGRLLPGEAIVLVLTASMHRAAAFEACAFLMDYLKTDAPFWKFEEWADGTGVWVEAKCTDDAARDRWFSRANSFKTVKF
jgi:molybdopterin synthase catalytic subunit